MIDLMGKPRRAHLQMLRSFTWADLFTFGNASCGKGSVFLCLSYLNEGQRGFLCAYSRRRLPLIPIERCRRFRSKPATPTGGIGATSDADLTPSGSCPFLNQGGRSRCQHRGYRCVKSAKSYVS